jgi:hypothetical protein
VWWGAGSRPRVHPCLLSSSFSLLTFPHSCPVVAFDTSVANLTLKIQLAFPRGGVFVNNSPVTLQLLCNPYGLAGFFGSQSYDNEPQCVA